MLPDEAEHLARYATQPPLAQQRVQKHDEPTYLLQTAPDPATGATQLALDPLEPFGCGGCRGSPVVGLSLLVEELPLAVPRLRLALPTGSKPRRSRRGLRASPGHERASDPSTVCGRRCAPSGVRSRGVGERGGGCGALNGVPDTRTGAVCDRCRRDARTQSPIRYDKIEKYGLK